MELIVVALIAGAITPTLQWAFQRSSKREDWARTDRIAEQAKKDAAAAAAAAAEVARLLVVSNEAARVVAEERAAGEAEIKGILTQVHEFTNERLTTALRAQLVALRGQRVVLADTDPMTPDVQAVIDAIDVQIAELEEVMVDRGRAQAAADAAGAKSRSAVKAIEAVSEAQQAVAPEGGGD